MIEVVHILNRHGKPMSFCLEYDNQLGAYTPAAKHYAQQYALGNEPPFYPLPVLAIGAKIECDIVDIITHKQPERKRGQFWVECDHEGWVLCLQYWRKDDAHQS